MYLCIEPKNIRDMNITQRELDTFVDAVLRMGYGVDIAYVTSFGFAELGIYNNGIGKPDQWHYDIIDLVHNMGFDDINIVSVSDEYMSAELY